MISRLSKGTKVKIKETGEEATVLHYLLTCGNVVVKMKKTGLARRFRSDEIIS